MENETNTKYRTVPVSYKTPGRYSMNACPFCEFKLDVGCAKERHCTGGYLLKINWLIPSDRRTNE